MTTNPQKSGNPLTAKLGALLDFVPPAVDIEFNAVQMLERLIYTHSIKDLRNQLPLLDPTMIMNGALEQYSKGK